MSPCVERFNRIAAGYDRLNRILSWGLDAVWRRRALERLKRIRPDAHAVLDLATGTADFALAAARAFPAAHVTGVDFSPAMLAHGTTKVACAGLAHRVTLCAGEASAVPAADATFEVALCAFGFRNFPDRPRALAEAARVLKPGGTLTVLEFFAPRRRLLGPLTAAWLRVATCLWARHARDAYDYLRRSIGSMCTAETFVAQARDAGFSCVAHAFFYPACTCLVLRKCDTL